MVIRDFDLVVYRGFSSEEERLQAVTMGITPLEPLFADRPVRSLDPEAVAAVFAANEVIRHVADVREKPRRFKSFSKSFEIARWWATSRPDSDERGPGYVAEARLHLEMISETGRANYVYRCQHGCLWIDPLQIFPMPSLRTGMDAYREAYRQNSYSFAYSRQRDVFDLNQEWQVALSKAERDQEMLLVHGELLVAGPYLCRVGP